tara:strand:- start:1598 stop:2071 length:474 start_codon:yes stop_codon:yes gene_type:complete
MLVNLQNFFSPEILYLWVTFGVVPLWLALIFFPNSRISSIFITSIFLPIVFSLIYIYMIYQLVTNGEKLIHFFDLYSGIENLHSLFSNDTFFTIFWIHFLGINLFLGAWISKDAFKYNIPKLFSGISLMLVYFTGPLGLFFYWILRIFFAKKISLHD